MFNDMPRPNGGGSEETHVKVIEQTIVAGQNTIETEVPIKRIVTILQKSDGSSDNIHMVEWSITRPNETWAGFCTNITAFSKKTVPNSESTNINSVSGTSFVYNVNSGDISRLGSVVQIFIYY